MNLLANIFRDDEPDMMRALADSIGDDRAKSLEELADDVGVSPSRAQQLLNRHPQFFVRVGDRPAYRLNGFSKQGGDLQAIRERINRKVRMHGTLRGVYLIVMLVCLVPLFFYALLNYLWITR